MKQYGSIRRGELRMQELNTQNNGGLIAIGIITLKSMVFSILAGALFMTAMVQIKEATAANLKNVAIVKGDLLRVGDVFDHADGKADIVIGRAPLPGKDMTLNARTLMRIARSTKVSWTPQSALDQVVVRREATLIDLNTIHSALSDAFLDKGLDGKLDIVIQNTLPQLVLPQNEEATVDVKTLRYLPQSGTFEAVLVAPSINNPLKTLTVNGQVHKRIMVPVLSRSLKAGDIISSTDMSYIDVRQRDLPKGALSQIADLQGMAAAKALIAGRPIRNVDIALPRMVDRGEMVTLFYNEGPVSLSIKGKALQNGAQGEMVRIVNLSSNKQLQGMVTGMNQVTIY